MEGGRERGKGMTKEIGIPEMGGDAFRRRCLLKRILLELFGAFGLISARHHKLHPHQANVVNTMMVVWVIA